MSSSSASVASLAALCVALIGLNWIPAANGLQCYSCTAAASYNAQCHSPSNTTSTLVTCGSSTDTCTTQLTGNDKYRAVIRRCGAAIVNNCVGVGSVKVCYLSCTTDLCNTSNPARGSIWAQATLSATLLSALLATLLKHLL